MDLVDLLRETYKLASEQSDDPVTKNAAIIVNAKNEIIGQGANQLPLQVQYQPQRLQRPTKYDYIIHAEQNAIASAARQGNSTAKTTMVCPWAACTACAKMIIQAGITKVITHKSMMLQSHLHWPEEIAKANNMLQEAGVELFEYDGFIGGVEHMFNGKTWTP